MSDWILRKSFIMHSGTPSDFKIECDALTDEEVETFALLISRRFKFESVFGVPRGGIRIASALDKYKTLSLTDPVLIVDDVLTTGWSMNFYHPDQHPRRPADIGVVLFACGPCPEWIHPVFQLWDMNS